MDMEEQFATEEIFMDDENSMNISYQQYRSSDDINFFFGHLKKCRICFKDLDTAEDQRIIESCHRQTFHAVSGVELSRDRNLSNYLCHDCADHLEISHAFWKSHGEMQKRYVTFVQHQILSDVDSDDQIDQSGINESKSSDEEIIKIRECSVYVKRLSANEIQMHVNNNEDNQYGESMNPELFEPANARGHGSNVQQQRHRKVKDTIPIPRPKNQECVLCNAAFRTAYELNEHFLAWHQGKRYICSFEGCDVAFVTRGGARRHLRVIHELNGDAYQSHYKMLRLM